MADTNNNPMQSFEEGPAQANGGDGSVFGSSEASLTVDDFKTNNVMNQPIITEDMTQK